MSEHQEQTPGAAGGEPAAKPTYVYHRENVDRYFQANQEMEATRKHLDNASEAMQALESTDDVEVFQKQIDLLKRRLYEQPQFFHQVFITEGTNAIAWEFQQPELGRDFIQSFWKLLTRDDAMSILLMRFIWNLPLGYKRTCRTATPCSRVCPRAGPPRTAFPPTSARRRSVPKTSTW